MSRKCLSCRYLGPCTTCPECVRPTIPYNPALQLWEILVPTIRRSDGKPYRTRFHRVWDTKVRAIAGGLTILQPAKGQWVSPQGDLFNERMIPVRISCTENQISDIADMTAAYYDQLAIMYYRISDMVVVREFRG